MAGVAVSLSLFSFTLFSVLCWLSKLVAVFLYFFSLFFTIYNSVYIHLFFLFFIRPFYICPFSHISLHFALFFFFCSLSLFFSYFFSLFLRSLCLILILSKSLSLVSASSLQSASLQTNPIRLLGAAIL